MNLRQINNEIKSYVNEASFSGKKYSNKLIKLVNKHFYVNLPIENYLHLDIILKENGNVVMRGDEYTTSNKIRAYDELEERYLSFREDIEKLLKNNKNGFDKLNKKDGFINLFFMLLITLLIVFVCYLCLIDLFSGNYWNLICFVIILTTYNVIPRLGNNLRNRYKEAYIFIKRLFKSLKKK